MNANIARKVASVETPAPTEEKKVATWGTDIPDDLVLDQKKLDDALKKKDERKMEEKDERKRKYNVKWDDEVQMTKLARKCNLKHFREVLGQEWIAHNGAWWMDVFEVQEARNMLKR